MVVELLEWDHYGRDSSTIMWENHSIQLRFYFLDNLNAWSKDETMTTTAMGRIVSPIDASVLEMYTHFDFSKSRTGHIMLSILRLKDDGKCNGDMPHFLTPHRRMHQQKDCWAC